ncbi:hypothetical protein BH23CHL5_BH23CHL5_07360 [soil metagenome]
MSRNLLKRFGVAVVAFTFAVLPLLTVDAEVQPSFDTIRVQDGEETRLYQASILWSPVIVPLADGSAWAFFTAQLRLPTEPGAEPALTNFRVLAARFDPSAGTWSPAIALPGEIGFGPSAVADDQGTVHLVYTIRANLEPNSYGSLVYLRSTPEGVWTGPTLVAANESAGHQLSPDLTVDASGGVHVAWQDQRNVSEELRVANASNADILISDLNPDGTWSEPVQLNVRAEELVNASRPNLLADGDRLVAVWSMYSPELEVGLDSATHVQWSTRPINDTEGWSEPQTLFERGDTLIGGRFLDVAGNGSGDIAVLFGRRTANENQLFLQRLPSGSDDWSPPSLVSAGNRGSYPRMSMGPDGTVYAVYNLSDSTQAVQVGAIAIAQDETSAGAEVALTLGEERQQGIASIAVDNLGRAWVIYLHELPGRPTPTEARVLRGAIIESLPAIPIEPADPVIQPLPPASPAAEATPSG